MRNLFILAVVSFCVLINGVAIAKEYKPMVVRAACSTPAGTANAIPLEKLAEIIERESKGQIKLELFLGGVLGDEQTIVKQLRSNEIQLGVMAAGNLTPFAPSATLTILPYLFPKKADAYKLFSNKEVMTALADTISAQSRTRPLGWVVGGYRVLTNSKRPINTIDDMAGIKWRVPPVALQLAAFRAWGVEPHPLPWIETFNGLQQGVIDGQENPHVLTRDTKFWEVQKYITNIHYMLWIGPLLVSERWFSKLDEDVRALFIKSAEEAIAYSWKWNENAEEQALEECLANGMVLNELSDEAVWIEKAQAIWPNFYDAVGGKEVIDRALKSMN